jgi:hypothetical protein
MIDLKKFFIRSAARPRDREPDSGYHPSDRSTHGLEDEYQVLIANKFRRWGISPSCVTIEVRQLGKASDGFDVFIGMIRLTHWHRVSALRVLIGLPLLEGKVRKSIRATWLADVSHFAGLWLHASEQMQLTGELQDLIALHAPISNSPPSNGCREPFPGYVPSSGDANASEPSLSEAES